MVQSAGALVTLVETVSPYPQAVLADQPLLYYRLEERAGSKVFDSSGPGYHGVSANVTPTPGPVPWLGSSAGFNGWTAQSSIAVPALLNPATSDSFFNQLTVEAWVKLNAWNDSGNPNDYGLRGIFCGDQWPEGSFQMTAANANYFTFGVRDSSGGGGVNDYFAYDPAVITTGVWLHLAAVYDTASSTFTLYTNGAPAQVVQLDYAPPANMTPSHLGAWMSFHGNLYRFLDGQLDEVAIYATALTPQRIAAHYQAALTPAPSLTITHLPQVPALRIEWAATGFVLQENSNATNPSGWTDMPAGNASPVVLPWAAGQKFFRLRQP